MGTEFVMLRPRAILSVLGFLVGTVPGAVYYAIEMTGLVGSLVLAALGRMDTR